MRGLRSSVRWRVVRLVELVDAVPGIVRTARTVKRRRRGVSAGALVVWLAECQIAGAECLDDVESARADGAGAPLRAAAATPSAPAARQLARRLRQSCRRVASRDPGSKEPGAPRTADSGRVR
jgi:hypothetical protein